MNKIILLLLAAILSVIPQIDSAKKYLHVREQKENRSPDIDRWNKFVGNRLGSPWCAAFVSWNIQEVSKLKSGRAKGLITRNSIPAAEVLKGAKVPPGSLAIWTNGNTPKGHVEIVLEWEGKSGTTIGGNTSAGRGSQSDGDGVYLRKRKIEPYNYFRIIYFTPI